MAHHSINQTVAGVTFICEKNLEVCVIIIGKNSNEGKRLKQVNYQAINVIAE